MNYFGPPWPWPFTPPANPQWESSADRNLAHRLDNIERELGLIRQLLQQRLVELADDSNPEVTHDESKQ